MSTFTTSTCGGPQTSFSGCLDIFSLCDGADAGHLSHKRKMSRLRTCLATVGTVDFPGHALGILPLLDVTALQQQPQGAAVRSGKPRPVATHGHDLAQRTE